ncbi:MAG: N-acetylglucosamine-6-phosphate deacetylase [Acidothermus sp.]|nr:N-acetylglucosamine-6-phosphate deacetylase [Acidothermus sp.]MCL6538612.1 N-acetylglucosamine-6-phosphate deacetylase [Acidothermus sp.]
MTIISAPRLVIGNRVVGPGAVVVEDGVITDVIEGRPAPGPHHLALEEGLLGPGLIDVQINGCLGVDFAQAGLEEWQTVCAALPTHGVTAFQPTIITNPIPDLVASLRRFTETRPKLEGAGARPLGMHVEGPFISPERRGVHDPRHMCHPTPDNLAPLLAERTAITMVTLAPELPGAMVAIRELVAAGIVVSIGHSDARATDVHEAVLAGARMVTHIFNAQRGLTHREPGVAGQALVEPALTLGLIADFHHVAPQVCALVMNAAPGRVALVTDAVAPAGMPPGLYQLAGQRIRLAAGDPLARNLNGTIAGAAIFLDQAVRNLVGIGRNIGEVIHAASTVPATVLGRNDLGRLTPGAAADLVWWSDTLAPLRTWVAGNTVYQADSVI